MLQHARNRTHALLQTSTHSSLPGTLHTILEQQRRYVFLHMLQPHPKFLEFDFTLKGHENTRTVSLSTCSTSTLSNSVASPCCLYFCHTPRVHMYATLCDGSLSSSTLSSKSSCGEIWEMITAPISSRKLVFPASLPAARASEFQKLDKKHSACGYRTILQCFALEWINERNSRRGRGEKSPLARSKSTARQNVGVKIIV